jgi:hypothetical protein
MTNNLKQRIRAGEVVVALRVPTLPEEREKFLEMG